MKYSAKKDKKFMLDYRGNAMITATWGTLKIPRHLLAFGEENKNKHPLLLMTLSFLAGLIAVGLVLVALAI